MPLIINTNTLSLNAQTHLSFNTAALTKSLEKLASGFRINRAGDDAAGLQLSESLRSQIRGSQQALNNVQDTMNMLNIVDGAYQTIEDNIQRIRELAVQAANDTYNANQRDAIQTEIVALYNDNDRIARSTEYNGVSLLSDVGVPVNFWLQIGANAVPGVDSIDIASVLGDTTMASGFGIGPGSILVDTHANAQGTITAMDAILYAGLTNLGDRRGELGATVNQLESAANNLSRSIENMGAAESRIRNVDVAAESATMIKYQVLQQSSAMVLAQANQAPSLALQLLQAA